VNDRESDLSQESGGDERSIRSHHGGNWWAGVLTAGQLLAEAAMADYACYLVALYRAAVRGGASECTVIFSQGKNYFLSFLKRM
jgi:hypothetical protein